MTVVGNSSTGLRDNAELTFAQGSSRDAHDIEPVAVLELDQVGFVVNDLSGHAIEKGLVGQIASDSRYAIDNQLRPRTDLSYPGRPGHHTDDEASCPTFHPRNPTSPLWKTTQNRSE